jgi:hypothetical protein
LLGRSYVDRGVFERAIDEISASTERLVHSLTAKAPVRTRENEIAKARVRWQKRAARMKLPRP